MATKSCSDGTPC